MFYVRKDGSVIKPCRKCMLDMKKEWFRANRESIMEKRHTEEYRRKTREYWKRYNRKIGPRNRKAKWRFMILERDGFMCCYCGRRPPDVILEVDHKIPRSLGGKDDMENMVTSCRECNRGKSDAMVGIR